MLTLKLIVGGSPKDVTGQYRAWSEEQRVSLVCRPQIEPAGTGWKLTVWYMQIPKSQGVSA
jgi:hypothetical protein